MRAFLRLLLVAALLGSIGPVFAAQSKGDASAKKIHVGPPVPNGLRSFHGAHDPPKDTGGLSLTAMAFIAFIAALVFGGMVIWFRIQAKEMGLPEDEAALASSGGPVAVGLSPMESVYSAVSRAGGWVTPGRVAMGAGISTQEAEGFLQDLARDGRVKAGRDKQGRILYRLRA